ncbi:MAG TPA: hypothetical protein VNS12_14775 [Pelagibacterium sp.]|uniref:hypothetical protein n=1 Tax=Pelagibacterium sp. TaxID=1967288 RepID=UPI002C8D22CE|nr:hypothetical protein [Pelagibacterium sp.]HWJ89328.1 hypothetical protein [Pelagibacterium sp.]
MRSVRERIFATLQSGLAAPDRPILRNAPIHDLGGRFLSLSDGSTELIEEYFNPERFEFSLRPKLTLLVLSAVPETSFNPEDAAARDEALDGLIEAISVAFSAISDWPDEVMDWRMLPPEFTTHEIMGAAGMKGCDIAFEIDYWSDRREG